MDYVFCKDILLFVVLKVFLVAGGLLLRDGECIKEVWRENKPYEYETICCAFYEMINGTCIKRESSTVSNKTGTYMIKVGFIVVSVTLLAFLIVALRICVPLTWIYLKYKVSCKKRDQSTDHTNTTHPNEPENNPPREKTHEYDEVDDRFLNRESSVNDEYDVRSSGGSTVGSGICGVDSDGYLNPYHALKSIKITIGQGPSSEQSRTETSFIQAQENIVVFNSQNKYSKIVN